MKAEEWVLLPGTIEKSKKQYAHFDYRTDLSVIFQYVKNPEKIRKHSFYPFIHYKKDMTKYSSSGRKIEKERQICYAAHIDRCIFQYYSFILNELYNERIRKEGISEVPIAYRSDLHQTNIHFSKKAFDFIKATESCYVMIGDFTGFFDNLDHQYLKKQWCNLLGADRLPPDHYAVFKNITKYSIWELDDLLELNGLENNQRGRKQLNKKERVLSKEKFHEYRSHIQKHEDQFGIPQGSPISALLANVYMLDVDRIINEIVKTEKGLFMRYSDDFIIVLPQTSEEGAGHTLQKITDIIDRTPGLTLQPDKTQYFHYENGIIENCGIRFHAEADKSKHTLDFLGFSFDGSSVRLRAKTISKYYYRMQRKAKTIAKHGGYTRSGKQISNKNIYDRYSIKGARSPFKEHMDKEPEKVKKRYHGGNFITYVLRAKKVFSNGSDGLEEQILNRHMQKIRKAIDNSDHADQRGKQLLQDVSNEELE